MEGKHVRRCLFLISSVVLVTLFTIFSFPSQISDKSELLMCATNSAWCNSKNRILRNPTAAAASLRHDHKKDVPHHPLDPLTIQEVNKVYEVIKSLFEGKVYSVHSLVLEDPDKEVVRKWKKGEELPTRKASVIARAAGKNYLLTVDVESGEVVEHDTSHISGFPLVTLEDMQNVMSAPFASAHFNRTIVARGVDLNDVACLPFSPGWFGNKISVSLSVFLILSFTVTD